MWECHYLLTEIRRLDKLFDLTLIFEKYQLSEWDLCSHNHSFGSRKLFGLCPCHVSQRITTNCGRFSVRVIISEPGSNRIYHMPGQSPVIKGRHCLSKRNMPWQSLCWRCHYGSFFRTQCRLSVVNINFIFGPDLVSPCVLFIYNLTLVQGVCVHECHRQAISDEMTRYCYRCIDGRPTPEIVDDNIFNDYSSLVIITVYISLAKASNPSLPG